MRPSQPRSPQRQTLYPASAKIVHSQAFSNTQNSQPSTLKPCSASLRPSPPDISVRLAGRRGVAAVDRERWELRFGCRCLGFRV